MHNSLTEQIALSTSSEVISVEDPVGHLTVINLATEAGAGWKTIAVEEGIGQRELLKAISSIHGGRDPRTMIAAAERDAFEGLMGTRVPSPQVLRAVFTRFRGLLVDGAILVAGEDPKPWLDVDWGSPRLNPIVAAITDGLIPPPEEADPVESYAAYIAKLPKTKPCPVRIRRFRKASSRARPPYHVRRLWTP